MVKDNGRNDSRKIHYVRFKILLPKTAMQYNFESRSERGLYITGFDTVPL